MKFAHCSDIHLGRRPIGPRGDYSNIRFEDYFTVFKNTIEDCLKLNIDAMIIAGDLFDKKELIPEVLEKSEELFKILKDNGIPVITIEGNHDNISFGKEYDSWILYLEKKGYLTRPYYIRDNDEYLFYPINIKGYNFYGLGYPGCFVNETIKALSERLAGEVPTNNVVIVHTALSGYDMFPGTVDRETIDLLKNKVAYIAGGHFHSYSKYPEESPYFFIPGSLEYWDIAENVEGKGFIIFDTDTKTSVFYNSSPRKKIDIFITSDHSDFDSFKESFIEEADKYTIKQNEDIVYVKIKLLKSFNIDSVWIENYILSKGALKVAVKIRYPGDTSVLDGKLRILGTDEVEMELISQWEFVGDNKELFFNSLSRLKLYQSENNETLFFEEMEKLIDSVDGK